jgi:uncharacterized protein (TIGR02453 family)
MPAMPLNPTELVSFLSQLHKHNNKEWFDEHRAAYQPLRTQFIDLTQDVIIGIAQFDSSIHADLKPEDTLFRINRDVRFSKDKSPYKTQFSAAISAHGRRAQMPMYYFHINEAGELFAAGGLYMPMPDKLAMIRRHLVSRPKEFDAFLKNKTFWKTFSAIDGEQLKRIPKGFDEDTPHADYLRLKSWTAGQALRIKQGMTVDDDVLPFVLDTYRAMHPLIVWLRDAVGV